MKQMFWKLMPYLFWLSFLILTLLLLIEVVPKTGTWPYWDKVYHLVAFAGVATLGLLSYQNKVVLLVGGLVVYGGVMELLQGQFTMTRMPSMLDWLADIVGILLAWGLALLAKKFIRKHFS